MPEQKTVSVPKSKPVPKNRPLPTTARDLRTLTLPVPNKGTAAPVAPPGVWLHSCLCTGVRYACAACGRLDFVGQMRAVPLSAGALVLCRDRTACAEK